jgi:hypothetical protein
VQLPGARRGIAVGRSVACVALAVVFFALPASAMATGVTVRIEGRTGLLFPLAPVTLPTTPVAPLGKDATGTCAANSVVGAVDAATNHTWDGTWSDPTGWSLDKIDGAAPAPAGQWMVLVDDEVINDSPCQHVLSDNDRVLVYPQCLSGTVNLATCFGNGPLELFVPALAGVGAPINVMVRQIDIVHNVDGTWSGAPDPSGGATVIGPDNSATSETATITPGHAVLTIAEKGPSTITAVKNNRPADLATTCVTDGGDGYCGTTIAPENPFDPLKFCQTTGSDGYCGSPDKVAPVGHIGTPTQGQAFKKGPTKFAGTVDFDPSQTDHVDLRLTRQIMVTVKIYKKRKVFVTKKIHGKKVRKRVTKRVVARKVKRPRCYGWSDSLGDFKTLKKCNPATAPTFRADGAEVWSYSFLRPVDPGAYTLDVIAVDGAGNQDSVPELGRNRVTFTVA